MLVDHAEAERRGIARAGDLGLPAVDQHLAGGRAIEAHHALHQRRLAGAVLAEQRVERAGRHLDRDVVERRESAEAHRHADRLDADGRGRRSLAGMAHGSRSTTEAERAMAPNTPPCIVTILIAARWLPSSVAPQQSSISRHSKPRSLASRIVVCTQTSVVMPVSRMLSMPRWRRISSRSVAQNEPLPGLSMIGSPASGLSSGMMPQPASPRTRMRPRGPGAPMPA